MFGYQADSVRPTLDWWLERVHPDDRPRVQEGLSRLAAGERHGYGIIKDAESRGEVAVPDVGTLYRALARLVDRGLIEPAERREAPEAEDERRTYYRLLPLGLRVAKAEARRLEALTRAARIGGLLEAK
jgi:DNA-binding PadR family transcriptional regulator